MGFESGDPVVQYYFRLNDLLYRSSAVYSDGIEFLSLIERSYMEVWEPVPGTSKGHNTEKKALARAKKLTDPLEHTPLIYLAYWQAPAEPDSKVEEPVFVRVTPGKESYLNTIGDYLIRPVGTLYALCIWDGFSAVEVGLRFSTLEGAVIAAIIRTRREAKEKADKEARPETPDAPTAPFVEQEPVTAPIDASPDDILYGDSDDLFAIRLDEETDVP